MVVTGRWACQGVGRPRRYRSSALYWSPEGVSTRSLPKGFCGARMKEERGESVSEGGCQ